MTLGVNLSPVQLAQADLTRTIGRIIGEVGVDPGRIVVELTESALVEPTAANLAKLQELKTLGLRLAADDFGTGFSSLRYLQRFPLDHLKIDRSFVHGVDVDDGAAALANSIITMGHALQLKCVAEGVETAGQADWLARTDCDAAQGHFLRPGVAPRPAAPAPHQRAPPVLEARAAGMTSACSRQEAP